MGTRKQINLRISGSRVLGRLKKSCKCCGNPGIYAIHLLPTAYPSKKLANSRERRKKKEKNLKKTSQDLTAARRILRTHPPFVFCYYFSLTLFFLFLQIFTSNLKEKKHLKRKKNQLQIKKMAHPSRRIRSLNI